MKEGKNDRINTNHSSPFQRDLLIFAKFTETSKLLHEGRSQPPNLNGRLPSAPIAKAHHADHFGGARPSHVRPIQLERQQQQYNGRPYRQRSVIISPRLALCSPLTLPQRPAPAPQPQRRQGQRRPPHQPEPRPYRGPPRVCGYPAHSKEMLEDEAGLPVLRLQ